jgi:hypothetical protein
MPGNACCRGPDIDNGRPQGRRGAEEHSGQRKSAKGRDAVELRPEKEESHMPDYECAVTKAHKRIYRLEQEPPPVCCGKPMLLKQELPQAAAGAQPINAATNPQALWSHEVSTIPQEEKKWWQLWK